MQTDIYCIWEKQWCTIFFPHRIILQHFVVLLFEIGVCCAAVRAESLGPPFNGGFRVSSQDYLLIVLPVSVQIPIFSEGWDATVSQWKKILTWPSSGASQSIQKSNKGNSTRNISKSRPSYLLWSQSFWYKTRLLQIFFFFATVFKTV